MLAWLHSPLVPAAVRLADGRPLTIRPVTPAARPLIERGLALISAETSRRRFFTVRRHFSDQELDAMTRLDGHARFALGATVADARGEAQPVGVARFARLPDAPAVAEVAVLVIDAFQGQGVGTALLRRLAAAAIARGIARFRGIMQPDNEPMIQLLSRHAPGPALFERGELVTVDIELTDAPAPYLS